MRARHRPDGELRVVVAHRAGADHDGIEQRPHAVVVDDVLGAGDPARGAVGGGDPAVQALAEMGDHEALGAAPAERQVELEQAARRWRPQRRAARWPRRRASRVGIDAGRWAARRPPASSNQRQAACCPRTFPVVLPRHHAAGGPGRPPNLASGGAAKHDALGGSSARRRRRSPCPAFLVAALTARSAACSPVSHWASGRSWRAGG